MSAKNSGKEPAACCGGQAVKLGNKVRDPLCGMAVDANSPHRWEGEGRSHRFCSEACRLDYEQVMRGEPVAGVAFTCVMHPEWPQEHPGDCPVCGMALAPARVSTPGGTQANAAAGLLGRLRSAFGL